MFNKNKSKGQTSIEILAILGVLVIGGIILGTFYLSNINKKTAEATEIANLDYNGMIGDLNEPIYGTPCGNSALDPGENCDGALFINDKDSCTDWGFTSGTLSCKANCTLNTSGCLGTFEIDATRGNNGSIIPEGTATYNANSTPSFVITADSGYEINTIILDGTTGVPVSSGVTTYTYTFGPLVGDRTIHATFKSVGTPSPPFTITSTADVNCNISPLGDTNVNEGDDQSYTIIPDANYEIDLLIVDGSEVIPVLVYDFINVQANHTIDVTCRIKDPAPPANYTIFAFTRTLPNNFLAGGTISPSGEVLVPAGNDQTFIWSANIGYLVGEVNVDGTIQKFSHLGNSYTFPNVDRNHWIRVTFVKNVGVNYTLTYTAGPNGTISGTSPQTVAKGGSGTPVNAVGNTNPDYTFIQWSDGSTVNPRTDTNVQGNITVAASFVLTPPEPMELEVSPTTGSTTLNTNFNVDVNTLENAPAVRYTLKVDFTDNSTGFTTSNCSYNGVYSTSITLGTNLAPSALSYTPFSCNTNGTYRLRFTATNDSTVANSASKDSTWTINVLSTVAKPIASPVGDRYSNDQSVTLTCSTPGSIIHYTLNGSAPDCSSTQYVSAIPITGNKTIRAIGCLAGWNPSPIMTEEYMLKVAKPTANPVGGPVNPNTTVSLSTTTIGGDVHIHYTTDGSTPTSTSPLYTSPITLTADTLLKAVGYKTGYTTSSIMTENYIMDRCNILSVPVYELTYTGGVPTGCGNETSNSPMDIRFTTCTNNLSNSLHTVIYNKVWLGPSVTFNPDDELAKLPSVGELFCQNHGLTFVAAPFESNLQYVKGNFNCNGPVAYGNQFTNWGQHGVGQRYTSIICANGIPKPAAPSASYLSSYVTFTSPTPGSTICYTMDGSEPVGLFGGHLICEGDNYTATGPIWINQPTNFKARAIMETEDYGDPNYLTVYATSNWVQSDLYIHTFP